MASSLHTRHHPPPTPADYSSNMNHTANNLPRRTTGTNTPLAPSPQPPVHDAPKQEGNIMNIRGTLDSSLYQICLSLRRRLAHVPGFHQYLAEMEEEEAEADGVTDPVTSMWNCLRRGFPLMTIYNAFRPHNPLHVDANRLAERQLGKAGTFKFLQACLTDLMIPANECFLITDLYGGDTTGFVKVTKVVNKVLDKLDEKGLLLPSDPRFQAYDEAPGHGSKHTQVQFVIEEIVGSERTYVQHLELLQQAKNELEAGGTVPGDSIHNIFLNLNALLDFQRRFLIRIEQQNSLPESQQNWGQLFVQYKESFRVYEPFIANQTRCNETVMREWDKISASPHSTDINDLFESQYCFTSFCVKPFQRLSKYPLLLKQLRTSSKLDTDREADLIEGEAAASSLMQRANEAVAREQRNAAVAELKVRVEDWKGHDMKQFGELLLYGNFTVVKGEGAKPAEREVCVIFDTFTPQMRCLVHAAVGQMRTKRLSPPSRAQGHSAPGKMAQAETINFITPSEARRKRQLIKLAGSFGRKTRALTFGTSAKLDSYESSQKRHDLPSLQSPKSPIFNRNPFRVLKTSKLWGSQPGLLYLPHFFFNGPLSAGTKMLRAGNNGYERSSNGTKRSSPLKPIKHIADPSDMERECIKEEQLVNPLREQYIIYLFEKILLCCKEVNPNKQRPKMLRNERAPVTINGKVRLQLKGRIFMQNVTDVLSFVRTGNVKSQMFRTGDLTNSTEKSSYTIQIFWKGDPGVENFIIRFSNENEMNRWRDQIQQQKQNLSEQARSSGQTGTSETVFTSMRTQSQPENPYLQNEDVEDEDDSTYTPTMGSSEFAVSRNASSNSLRNTAAQNGSRGPSSRLAFTDNGMQPPLSLNTNVPAGADSPGDFPGNSYFSPSAESPSSIRSSSQAGLYPFSHQGTPVNPWSHEDSKHKTAPAASGSSLRDGSGPLNAYQMNGRTVLRPSLPVMPANQASHAAQQLAMAQNRMRSASTPNIHDPAAANATGAGARRYANGQVQPTIDNVPVPPIPLHMAQMRAPLNRSQTSSPTSLMPGARSATQSPMPSYGRPGNHAEQAIYNQPSSSQRHPGAQADQRSYNQGGYGPAPIQVLRSPPMPMHTASEDEIPYPSQLKVKIWFDPAPSHVTIVVPIVIKHRSLIDRIDSKMVKISSASISKGTARLKYKDMEEDYVTIGSDEDVQLAIEDWGQAHAETLREGVVSDFELHWEEKQS